MPAESRIMNECMVALSSAGCTIWRNNTGVLKDANGRPIKFGLCVGGSDLVGIAPDGLFLAIECKSPTGRATQAQERFVATVLARGGRAGIVRSAAEAVRIATGPLQQKLG